MTLWRTYEESFEESSESLLSSRELRNSSSSTASLALRLPRVWVKARSLNTGLLPLILKPFCFRYISSYLWVKAFTTCSIAQEISGRVFLSLTIFWLLHRGTQGAVRNFYLQSRPRCQTGSIPLAKTFLQKRAIFPWWTISISRHLEETCRSGLQYTLP